MTNENDGNDAWYYTNGSDRKGPVPLASMAALADAGVITSHSKVWREGMGEWEPAFKHVRGVLPPVPEAGTRPHGAAGMPPGETGYQRQVGFGEAFGLFWKRYFDFSGRSNRGEFWWWWLAALVIAVLLSGTDFAITGSAEVQPISSLWALITLIPNLALAARRLHDTNRSGWWQLLMVVPLFLTIGLSVAAMADPYAVQDLAALSVVVLVLSLVGLILLIVWWAQQGTRGPNRFG